MREYRTDVMPSTDWNISPLRRYTKSNTDLTNSDNSNSNNTNTRPPDIQHSEHSTTVQKKLSMVGTLGVYRVRNFFRHWVIVSRIMTKHGLFLREARHRQRER